MSRDYTLDCEEPEKPRRGTTGAGQSFPRQGWKVLQRQAAQDIPRAPVLLRPRCRVAAAHRSAGQLSETRTGSERNPALMSRAVISVPSGTSKYKVPSMELPGLISSSRDTAPSEAP